MLNPIRISLKRSRAVFPQVLLLSSRGFAATLTLTQPQSLAQKAQLPLLHSFKPYTAGLALPLQTAHSNSNTWLNSNPLAEVEEPQVSETQRELDKNNRPEYLTEYYLPHQFRRQEKISRYSLNGIIGHGFFATVYKAVDKAQGSTPEPVAIKSVSKTKCPLEIVTRELETMRFLQPFAKATSCLGEIKDVFETQTTVNFVLALCDGGDLFDFVSSHGKLSETQAKQVMHSLFRALECLHSHDVLHRDIKLENLLLKKKGDLTTCQLVDFGYAKRITDKDVFKNPAGTYGYVAPEVLSHRQYTPAVDMWSAGVVLYTILSGQQPFPYNSKDHQQTLSSTASTTTATVDHNNSSVVSEDGFQRRKKSLLSVELEAITHGRSGDNWTKELQRGPFVNVSTEAKQLMSSLLELNPKNRPTATQALNHPWFKAVTCTKLNTTKRESEKRLNM